MITSTYVLALAKETERTHIHETTSVTTDGERGAQSSSEGPLSVVLIIFNFHPAAAELLPVAQGPDGGDVRARVLHRR
jgi:hypothetical protein